MRVIDCNTRDDLGVVLPRGESSYPQGSGPELAQLERLSRVQGWLEIAQGAA